MDFLLTRGRRFEETFDFKNAEGQSITTPSGTYLLVLERGTFAREYRVGRGLVRNRTAIVWTIPAEETNDFEYRTMYYTLYLDDQELARGVIKVQ